MPGGISAAHPRFAGGGRFPFLIVRLGRRTAAVVLACLTLVGCGGGIDDPQPVPTLSVSVGGPVGLVQGESNSTAVTVTRGGGFSGAVSLSVSGLSAGVTGKFEPPSVPAGAGTGSSTLTLNASLGATLGSGMYSVTVGGLGVAAASASAGFTVAEAPGFTMDVAPNVVSIEQGRSGVATVSFVRRGGFGGPIALSVEGLPTGVTATFDNAAPLGATALLVLSVEPAVAVASYPLVVKGQGTPGIRSVGLTLTVTAAQPVHAFSIGVNPATLAVTAGSSGQVLVTISRSGGFAGPVTLSVAGQPAGITASFDASPTAGSTATLTLATVSGVAPGSYGLVVRGVAAGLADQTANLGLSVTLAAGGFSLAAAPSSLVMQVGRSTQGTILVTKTGSFSGNVTLAALNLPAGVTASFAPPAPGPGQDAANSNADTQVSSTLTLAAGPVTVSGNYSFLVRGSAAGQPDQTIALSLVINPPPGTGNTTFTFCGSSRVPVWFAFRNGTGSWTRVIGVPTAGGASFSFDVTGPLGAAAFVTGSEFSGWTGRVYEGTQAELQQFGASQCPSSLAGNSTLTGAVSGLVSGDRANIDFGAAGESASASSPTFTLKGAPAGAADLLAVRSRQSAVGTGFATTPFQLIARRGVTYPNGSTIPVLAFAAEGFVPASATATVANLGADMLSLFMNYQTASTTAVLHYAIETGGASQTIYGVPVGQQQVSDLHELTLAAGPVGSGDSRTWMGWFKVFGNRSVTLADVLAPTTVTRVPGSPYLRYQATGTIQSPYDGLYALSISQNLPDGTGRVWTIQSSRTVFGGANYTLIIPDLSPVAGWSPGWALQSGSAAEWVVTGTGISSNAVIPPGTDGSVVQSATRSGTVFP
jgi:hypothetical protein